MSNNYRESRIAIRRFFIIVIGVLVAAAFTVGAFALHRWAWLIALPMNAAGIALIVVGSGQRERSAGSRGTGVSALGGLLIAGSIWAAFMLGDAID